MKDEEIRRLKDQIENEQKNVGELDEKWKTEDKKRREREKEAEELKTDLNNKNEEIHELTEQIRQYKLQNQKMPGIINLYRAYDTIMQKKDKLPRAFVECLQKAVDMDDFDRFLPAALKRNFPISCYMALQSFIIQSRN